MIPSFCRAIGRASRVVIGLTAIVLLGTARPADAFCGFYVSGADTKLFNNATQVVLLRDGLRTVLSMQNNYRGPPASFAMVVPVPVVLQRENVKTLPREIFAKLDELDAPRLVEYWEQDPCYEEKVVEDAPGRASSISRPAANRSHPSSHSGRTASPSQRPAGALVVRPFHAARVPAARCLRPQVSGGSCSVANAGRRASLLGSCGVPVERIRIARKPRICGVSKGSDS